MSAAIGENVLRVGNDFFTSFRTLQCYFSSQAQCLEKFGEIQISLLVACATLAEVQVSLFVASAVFAEGQVSLFVADAALGEIQVSLFVAGAILAEVW